MSKFKFIIIMLAVMVTSCEKENITDTLSNSEIQSVDPNSLNSEVDFTTLIYKDKKFTREEVANNQVLQEKVENAEFYFQNHIEYPDFMEKEFYLYDSKEKYNIHQKVLDEQFALEDKIAMEEESQDDAKRRRKNRVAIELFGTENFRQKVFRIVLRFGFRDIQPREINIPGRANFNVESIRIRSRHLASCTLRIGSGNVIIANSNFNRINNHIVRPVARNANRGSMKVNNHWF
ncbi:hypothetical protein [Aquimarina sp. RZ0]|uniref:hypothetical protein n=1 Tax=Aquimarina sp. RZ0 TaxID=2607730 RepID=UPI0011F373CA|nr:hypothetical protein [Aquimarina sp. RZ0]KAA1243650.1 hypothetical protein F0000_20020 [Aquimarina sp. RZ0]